MKTQKKEAKGSDLTIQQQAPKTTAATEDTGSPANLLRIAIENKADVSQLKELMDLQDRWLAQKAKKNFLASISQFQADVPEIKKTKVADYGQGKAKYKFADIADVDKAIKAPMQKNGLSKRWEVKDDADKLIVSCIISHVDGHSETTTMSSLKDNSPGKNEIQMRASAITYLKRYTMTSALGITTADEDVDGATPKVEPTDDEETKELKELLKLKKDALTAPELTRANEIIRTKEKNSYAKLRATLATK